MNYKKVIAVDFDGCLCTKKWPEIGEPNWAAIHELIRRQAEGDKIILWTCRVGKQLEEAVLWCVNHGLKFDAINENLPEHIEHFGNDCRKVFANEYWDDKALPVIADYALLTRSMGGKIFIIEHEDNPGLFERLKERVLGWIGKYLL